VLSALVMVATLALAALLLHGLPAEDPRSPGVRLLLALAIGSLAVLPVQTPWYDAVIFALLALMPASGFDYLLIARCLLLTELLLPGAAPDTGAVSLAAALISHVGIFVILALIIGVSLRRPWRSGRVRPVAA